MENDIKVNIKVPKPEEEFTEYLKEELINNKLLNTEFKKRFLCYDFSDLLNLCRICLSAVENMKSLVHEDDNNLRRMFTSLTSIQLHENDSLPSSICSQCCEEVAHCYEFKEKCEQVDAFLKEKLNEKMYFNQPDLKTELKTNIEWKEEENKPAITKDDIEDYVEDVEFLEDFIDDIPNPPTANKSTRKSKRRCKRKKWRDTDLEPDFKEKRIKTKRKHTTNDENYNSLSCTDCSKNFSSLSALKAHMKRSHDAALSHRCAQCDYAFSNAHDLQVHSAVHASGPPWICVQCDKSFPARNQLRRHLYRHMQLKRYLCAQCDKGFSELYQLRRHTRVHSGEPLPKLLACAHCPKRFAARSSLETHVSRHVGNLNCVCPECGKKFVNNRLLKSHMLLHSNTKQFQCKYCEKRFRHESTLTTHHRTHTGDRPYVCDTCGKAFIANSNLTLHMRVHTGERPYVCKVCARRFSSGSALACHHRIHTGEKPFSCPVCHKRFARSDLSRHMARHDDTRPHACLLCPRRFYCAALLRDHAKLHSAEKAFECADCGRSKYYVARHLKNNCKHEKLKEITQAADREHPLIIFDPLNENIHEVIVDTTSQDQTDQILLQQAEPKTNIIIVNEDEAENYQNVCLTSDGNVSLVTPGMTGGATPAIKVYHVDQSLLQIHSAGGQLTISKITSKMTANFQ